MTKLELIDQFRKKCNLPRNEAAQIVDLFFRKMSESLVKGDRVEIRDLFSFRIKQYGSYIGKNPKTGESIKVPPKKMPFFNAGKELKKRLNS